MKFIQTQTSFKSGQLSRKLDGRIDIKEYKDGCYELTNMAPLKTGGVKKFPGDITVAEDVAGFTFLKEKIFIFNDGVARKFQFWSQDAGPFTVQLRIITPDTGAIIQSLNTDIVLLDVDENISMAQYEDTVWVTTGSGTNYMRGIVYTAGVFSLDASFNMALGNDNPFHWPMELVRNLEVSIVSTAGAGQRNLTINTGVWSDHTAVGEIFAIVGVTQNFGDKYVALNFYKIISLAGANAVGEFYYQLADYPFTGVDPMQAGAEGIYREIYFQAWGSKNGHPSVVSADDGRLIAASPPKKPATIYGSIVSDSRHFNQLRQPTSLVRENNFSGPIVNTDPYIFTLASTRTAKIKFMASSRALIIGTDERVYVANGGDGIVGPLNVQIRPFNSQPASAVFVNVDNGIVYITNDGKRAVNFNYNTDNGSFVSQEVSTLSDDLYTTTLGIKELVFNEKHSTVFMMRRHIPGFRGSLIILTLTGETQVTAHASYTLEEPLQSITYNPIDGKVHFTYNYDSRAVYTSLSLDEPKILRSDFLRIRQDLSNVTELTTWTYDYGKVGDLVTYIIQEPNPPFTPIDGEVGTATLDGSKQFTTVPTKAVNVGRSYRAAVSPMPVEAGQQWGSAQMGVKRVDTVSTRFLASHSYRIKELNSNFIEERILAETTPSGLLPFTGVHETKLSSTPQKEQVICVENDKPEPFTVLGMSYRGVSNDG